MKYYINKSFIIHSVESEIIIYDTEKSYLHILNETSAFIFKKIKNSSDQEVIIKDVVARFDVSVDEASNDVRACINELVKKKIIIND